MWKLRSECFQEYKRSGLSITSASSSWGTFKHSCLRLPFFSPLLISFDVCGVKRWRYSFLNLNFILFSFSYDFSMSFPFFFNLGITPWKAKQPLEVMELHKKKQHKIIKAYWKSLYKEPTVNRCLLILDLKPLRSQVKRKRKAFYRQIIPESSSVRKGTVDLGILVTSRNGDRKIMRSIRNRGYIMQRAHHLSLDPFSPRNSALDSEEKMFCCFLNSRITIKYDFTVLPQPNETSLMINKFHEPLIFY